MRWLLFQQVMRKLAAIRELDPERDAARFAEVLLELHPELFAEIDGGPASVRARMAARTIAVDHLREVCRLPIYVDELERSLARPTMSPSSRLVRIAALAYLLCPHDLYRDGLPVGFGLIDDCIAVRGAVLATPPRQPPGGLGAFVLRELLRARYLGVALPSEVLGAAEQAMTYSAELAARARGLPAHQIEAAIVELVERPPSRFPAALPLPDPPSEIEAVLHMLPGRLVEAEGEALVFAFADGSRLRREPDGSLRELGA